ncbi:MAG: hypothetical protein ACFFCX_12025 [Candidatus Sifarchaeia archaeon]
MKPIDEDVTPPPDDIPEDVDDVEAEIEEDFKTSGRRSRTRRRRTKLQEYGSIGSMIVWMAFLIIWLFFFAGNYQFFENIAVVIIALFIAIAANALLWIPSAEGWRARSSAVSGILWIVFLIVWITFFAVDFGIYENIGIGIASLLIIGAVNVMLWVPSTGDGWGARISALGGIGWLTFMVLWLPFANDILGTVTTALDFPYKNLAIILAAFLVMLCVTVAPWSSEIRISIEGVPGGSIRAKGSLAGFLLWLLFLVIWMWFFAGDPTLALSGYQNVAVILISFALFAVFAVGMWLPWARRRGEGPENWWAVGLAFLWVISLALWFWFFAGEFDAYQNFAVFLVTLVIMVAISGGAQWRKYRDFEAMDWED